MFVSIAIFLFLQTAVTSLDDEQGYTKGNNFKFTRMRRSAAVDSSLTLENLIFPESIQSPQNDTFSVDPAKLFYPGTKWCGPGNISKDYNDLGNEVNTDACCRAHDHCSISIESGTNRYGYFNKYDWPISSCDCDSEFSNCLKSVNTDASESVRNIYFSILNIQCFYLLNGTAILKPDGTSAK